MRRAIIMALVGVMLASSGGCGIVIGNRLAEQRFAARHPVAVDGRLYVVDVKTGEVMKLPDDAVERAGSFHPVDEDGDD